MDNNDGNSKLLSAKEKKGLLNNKISPPRNNDGMKHMNKGTANLQVGGSSSSSSTRSFEAQMVDKLKGGLLYVLASKGSKSGEVTLDCEVGSPLRTPGTPSGSTGSVVPPAMNSERHRFGKRFGFISFVA